MSPNEPAQTTNLSDAKAKPDDNQRKNNLIRATQIIALIAGLIRTIDDVVIKTNMVKNDSVKNVINASLRGIYAALKQVNVKIKNAVENPSSTPNAGDEIKIDSLITDWKPENNNSSEVFDVIWQLIVPVLHILVTSYGDKTTMGIICSGLIEAKETISNQVKGTTSSSGAKETISNQVKGTTSSSGAKETASLSADSQKKVS